MSKTEDITLISNLNKDRLELSLSGTINVYTIPLIEQKIPKIEKVTSVILNLNGVHSIDTAGSLYVHSLEKEFEDKNIDVDLLCENEKVSAMLLNIHRMQKEFCSITAPKQSFLEQLGGDFYHRYEKFMEFLCFFGKISYGFFYVFSHLRSFRYKEILFEINENALRAFAIVGLTSFLVGIVVAYQSAYQLKIYGANIFIVDMLGLSILRELAPLLTAIVIAGRSGSAFTAQIGAMKITEELDAMRTMGFDPIIFLVLPRIIALMIMMPLLIFLADVAAILGGIIVANLDLGISTSFFLDRFNEVIATKHFMVGIVKGPFFAFLIASIGVFQGMLVKEDTQSIGTNTTKSVVESIFAVIVCDAVFSIIFTNLGI